MIIPEDFIIGVIPKPPKVEEEIEEPPAKDAKKDAKKGKKDAK